MINDLSHVVHARAAGWDVHKMQITAIIRQCETQEFRALASGSAHLREWLSGQRTEAATRYATECPR